MLAVSPVPVPDTGARASDGAHGWTRVLSTYPCVNQAEQVITGARSAVQSIAPSDPFPDKQWMESAYLAVCATQEAMIGKAFALIGAAYHHLTTSSPKLFLPKPDMHLTCHHRNALLAIARWHVAQVWFGAATEPELTIFRGVHPTLDAITKVFPNVLDSLPVALCYQMCVREHMRAGGSVKTLLRNIPTKLDGPKPSHLYWGKSIFRDRLSAFCIMEGENHAALYPLLDDTLKTDLGFNVHLIALAGDEVLSQVPEKVYQEVPISSAWVLEARHLHYSNNPKRVPWLRVVSVLPKLVLTF